MTIAIRMRTIDHSDHRYPTVGDWIGDEPGRAEVLVSAMPDWRYEFLIGLHELIEATLCNARGIGQARVDAFDKEYEADRAAGKHGEADEPGDDPAAPYFREHGFASAVERLMAVELGVDWNEYAAAIGALG